MQFGKHRFALFILSLTAIVALVGGGTTYFLYTAAMEEQMKRLVEDVKSQARLMESIARFDSQYSHDYPEGARGATLQQIYGAYAEYPGFGGSGEYTLALQEGGQIVFLLRLRHTGLDKPNSVGMESGLAEPMRRALAGQSGVMVGRDYRGVEVLAAYEPVAFLNLGLVVKIDMTEVRAPYVTAGLMILGFSLFAIIGGAGFFMWVFNFLTRSLAEKEQLLRQYMNASRISSRCSITT